MRKIRCLFKRNFSKDIHAQPELNDGMGWVIDPNIPTVPTEKFDGTAVLVDREGVWKRRKLESLEVQSGYSPTNWKPAQNTPSGDTFPGWMPVQEGDPEDQWHVEGFKNTVNMFGSLPYGTYELIGPKVQGNPYELSSHELVRHGSHITGSLNLPNNAEDAYNKIKTCLHRWNIEGIVFHEIFGDRMAKITRRDFNIRWPVD